MAVKIGCNVGKGQNHEHLWVTADTEDEARAKFLREVEIAEQDGFAILDGPIVSTYPPHDAR